LIIDKICTVSGGVRTIVGPIVGSGQLTGFKGKIDEVRIYSRDLNLTEIKTLAGQ
jgi:hypothetical protein